MVEINSEDFKKLNLRVGKIKAAKPHPKTDDYILLVDLGPAGTDKQLVANLKDSYSMEDLMGQQVLFIQNYKPSIVEGVETIGLLLVTHKNRKPVLLQPNKDVETGVKVMGLNNTTIEHHEPGPKKKC